MLADFDVVKETGGPNRGVASEFKGVRVSNALEIEFVAKTVRSALVCGVELVEEK